MYLHLVYYSGDRSLVESIRNDGAAGIVADRTFFLDAVDNDGDALRFGHNNGNYYDVIFLHGRYAQEVYGNILSAIRENRTVLEADIRDCQVADEPEE